MNAIIIEKVANGWVVRDHRIYERDYGVQYENIYVYHTIDEIQEALPELLKEPMQGQDTVKGFTPP